MSMTRLQECWQTMEPAENEREKGMKVTKMHGIGNDYFYFNEEPPVNVEKLAVLLSDRHRSLGSDGLIYICRSECADFRMRIFNADGSEAKMCGNGIRCVGKYVYDKGMTEKKVLQIETESGIKTLHLHIEDGKVKTVSVDMGKAAVGEEFALEIEGRTYAVFPVSVGNPHVVIFTDEEGLTLPEKIGSFIEHHPLFPDGVNVEFVHILSSSKICMRVWERGSGVTMACGTGACASVAASAACGYCAYGETVSVELDGGELEIAIDTDGNVQMSGPAEFAYEAEVRIIGNVYDESSL